LQKLARELKFPHNGLPVIDPVSSNWNKIDHRLFSSSASERRGRALAQLIAANTGLK
jgi:hypothetical protein